MSTSLGRHLNFWLGCAKLDQRGCSHCIMFHNLRKWGKNPFVLTPGAEATWNAPANLNKPAFWNVCNSSDFFWEAADPYRADAWEVMRASPRHTFHILTRRPERIAACLPPDFFNPQSAIRNPQFDHVLIGISISTQTELAKAAPFLKAVPGPKFLAAAPLLGFLDLRTHFGGASPLPAPGAPWAAGEGSGVRGGDSSPGTRHPALSFVVAQGELGPSASPTHPIWLHHLRDQCRGLGIPFNFDGWGEWSPLLTHEAAGLEDIPNALLATDGAMQRSLHPAAIVDFIQRRAQDCPVTMLRRGADETGRALDGRVYQEYPP